MGDRKWGNPRPDLDRAAEARVRELSRARISRLERAAWVIAAACLALLASTAIARADGSPLHRQLECDPVCVVDYCDARCDVPDGRTDAEERECRRACVRYVTEHGCWPCREGG